MVHIIQKLMIIAILLPPPLILRAQVDPTLKQQSSLIDTVQEKEQANYCGFTISASEEKEMFYHRNSQAIIDTLRKHGFDVPKDYFENISKNDLGKSFSKFSFSRRKEHTTHKMQHDTTNNMQHENTVTSSSSSTHYDIPIQVHIWGNPSTGTYPVTPSEVNDDIAALNDEMEDNNVPITFYKTCNTNMTLSNYNVINGESEYLQMFNNNSTSNAMDLHYVHDAPSQGVGVAPGGNPNYTLAIRNYDLDQPRSTILVHEIGHTLGLLHTHHARGNTVNNYDADKCHQEPVSRSKSQGLFCLNTGDRKCKVNGDKLCDTPADPNLNYNGYSRVDPNTCNFNPINGYPNVPSDEWGETWTPSVDNIMSYNFESTCTPENFTTGQVGVMLGNIPSFAETSMSIYIAGTPSVCNNENVSYSTVEWDPTGADSYDWELPPGWTFNSGEGTQFIDVNTGNYTPEEEITVTPNCGGPRVSTTVESYESKMSIQGPQSVCPGESYDFQVEDLSAASYNWTLNHPDLTITSSTNSHEITVAVEEGFNDYVNLQVTVNNLGCGGINNTHLIYDSYSCSQSLRTSNDSTISENDTLAANTRELHNKQADTLNAINKTNKIKLYPNPAKEKVTIQLRKENSYNIKVIDQNSRTISEKHIKGSITTFNIESWPKGMYYVNISYKSGKTISKKLIKK